MAIGDTTLTVVGNLTADPELRFTTTGHPVAAFTVAASRRVYDRDTAQWRDGDTLFLRCSAWRHLAEHVVESLTKGTRVVVTGRLRQRDYETRDGEKRTVFELDVEDLGPSLRYATAKLTKTTRAGIPHPAELAGTETGGSGGLPTGGDPWAGSQTPQPTPAGRSAEPPF
ncbi:MAG: single-stranded DNA-binding protein [Streptomycetales bacterium]